MPIFCNYADVEGVSGSVYETGSEFRLAKIKLDGESPRRWYRSSVSNSSLVSSGGSTSIFLYYATAPFLFIHDNELLHVHSTSFWISIQVRICHIRIVSWHHWDNHIPDVDLIIIYCTFTQSPPVLTIYMSRLFSATRVFEIESEM